MTQNHHQSIRLHETIPTSCGSRLYDHWMPENINKVYFLTVPYHVSSDISAIINSYDAKPPPFESSPRDNSNEPCFTSPGSLGAELRNFLHLPINYCKI